MEIKEYNKTTLQHNARCMHSPHKLNADAVQLFWSKGSY